MVDGRSSSMVFDGRCKIAVYHGHRIGELYDTESDPGEFNNLWDDPGARELKRNSPTPTVVGSSLAGV